METQTMIQEDVLRFLGNIPPFQFLDESTLKEAAAKLSMEFFPKNAVILKQEAAASEFLYIIKKGGVRLSVKSGESEEMVIDYRGEGDTFGLVSLMAKDKQKTTVVAIDDTICYLLGREAVYRLIDTNPSFTEYLLQLHFTKYIDKTYREMHSKSLFYGSSDQLLFTTPVGDIAVKDVITARKDITVRQAAQEMVRNSISSLVIVDDAENPVGIITDRDLREKVVARGRDASAQVKDIMSLSLVRVDAKDYCFEAVLRMIKYNIHHILVIRDGRLSGVLTNHDLMLLQGTSPLSFAKDLESQHTIEGLVPVSLKVNRVVGLLLKEGARASNITRIITELNDRLLRKVLEIAEKKFGAPPVAYCWVAFGSEGRKEQTFKTDQDNAVILADAPTPAAEEAAVRYFTEFTAFVKDGLLRCGFPTCRADYMASNPRWRQPLRTWKRYISTWISTPSPEALMHAVTFFDFRPVYGDTSLAEELRTYLTVLLKDQKVFLGHLANMIIKNSPPIGFFKSFVVEKSEEHKDELNLKVKGIAPLVDVIRLFALERGVRETSTLERIEALRGVHTVVQEYADEFEHAFEFIMLLRIQHQYEQISAGRTPDNFVNPDKLSNLEKRSIKDAFRLIAKTQDQIIERYKSLIW
jgi:CBS domain-containing protein